MGKNKRRFIDKKNASHYTLMHRSQRDVGGDILDLDSVAVGTTGMILWPSPHNNPDTDRKVLVGNDSEQKDVMREWRTKLAEVGLLEEHDEQYLKPITGTGTFLSATGKVDSALNDPRSAPVSEELLAEVNQKFEGIPLATDVMDDDIQAALMGDFDEGDFEEIADDFVFEAAREPTEGDQEAFDFDAHIAKLMEDARRQAAGEDSGVDVEAHDWGAQDKNFFSKTKPLRGVDEEEEDDSLFGTGTTLDVVPGVVPSLNPDEERALCEQFEKTLLEYDSDEMGDIVEEEIQGDRPLEGDAQVDAALDDYLQEKQDDIFMQGHTHERDSALPPKGGSGFSALVGTRMVPVKELNLDGQLQLASEPARPIDEVLKEAKKKIQSPILGPPPEEIFIDGKSYFSMKEHNPWDCESILTTYSNLDNNPVVIGTESRRKKKKQQQQQKIVLSNKTGLPTIENPVEEDDYDQDNDDDDYNDQTFISVNRGVPRKKKETAEEKRARKAQVKEERQMARIQKKATKEVYKEEFMNHAMQGASDDVAGKAVFRYS